MTRPGWNPALPVRGEDGTVMLAREGRLPRRLIGLARVTVAALACAFALSAAAGELVVVREGQAGAGAAVCEGGAWDSADGGLSAQGTGRFLYAAKSPGAGDFRLEARLKLERLEGTAASFVLGENHLGFDGRGATGSPYRASP